MLGRRFLQNIANLLVGGDSWTYAFDKEISNFEWEQNEAG